MRERERVCASASARFYYKTNHSASLCLWVCANAPRLSNSYLTSSIRIYIPQVFFEWYILSITISNTDTAEAKAERKNRISRKMSFCYSSRSMLLVPLSLFFLDFQIEYSCLHLRSHPENVRFVAFVFIFWWFFFVFFDASIHHLHLACISPIFNMLSYPFSCKPVEQRWGQHGRRMCCLGSVCINDNIRAYVDTADCFVEFFALAKSSQKKRIRVIYSTANIALAVQIHGQMR